MESVWNFARSTLLILPRSNKNYKSIMSIMDDVSVKKKALWDDIALQDEFGSNILNCNSFQK